MAEQVAGSANLVPSEFAFQATAALLAAETDQPDRARKALDRLTTNGLAALPLSSTWLVGMLGIVETALRLDDAALAAEAYPLLLPYAELPMMPSLAVSFFGSVSAALGLAALSAGRLDQAIDHLERAVTANTRLGHRPITACCQADLGATLLRRGRASDQVRAGILDRAAAEAEAMDMPQRRSIARANPRRGWRARPMRWCPS